jgi:hypothetical protein
MYTAKIIICDKIKVGICHMSWRQLFFTLVPWSRSSVLTDRRAGQYRENTQIDRLFSRSELTNTNYICVSVEHDTCRRPLAGRPTAHTILPLTKRGPWFFILVSKELNFATCWMWSTKPHMNSNRRVYFLFSDNLVLHPMQFNHQLYCTADS